MQVDNNVESLGLQLYPVVVPPLPLGSKEIFNGIICFRSQADGNNSVMIERVEFLLQSISISLDDELLAWILQFTNCLQNNFGERTGHDRIFSPGLAARAQKPPRVETKGHRLSIQNQSQIHRSRLWQLEDLTDTSKQLYIKDLNFSPIDITISFNANLNTAISED